MPYTLGFDGDFFQIADFVKSLDDMVGMHGGLVDVKGRLLTVDGFTLSATSVDSGTPGLSAELHVTSFLTPPDQGITAGATPTGPAPVTATPNQCRHSSTHLDVAFDCEFDLAPTSTSP